MMDTLKDDLVTLARAWEAKTMTLDDAAREADDVLVALILDDPEGSSCEDAIDCVYRELSHYRATVFFNAVVSA